MTTAANSTATKTVNFTEAQEQIIRDYAAKVDRPLNYDDVKIIAAMPAMFDTANNKERSPRSVNAKLNRMEIAYARQEAKSKDGSPVTQKKDLATRIAKIVEGNLDGLDKAPKAALVALAEWVEANVAREAA